MTVTIASDLHCHGRDMPKAFNMETLPKADVLVLAGDVAIGPTKSESLARIFGYLAGKFRQFVFIPGNHDFYNSEVDPPYGKRVYPPSRLTNYMARVNEKDGDRVVDFICTTLWSPIRNEAVVKAHLNDYNFITGFTPRRCTELFWENLKWLEGRVAESRRDGHDYVIVTHHLPRRELIDPVHEGSEINEAFCVLDEEAEGRLNALRPKLWIHGHSHSFCDMTIDGTRYIRNPVGYEYQFSTGRKERTGYVHGFTVDV